MLTTSDHSCGCLLQMLDRDLEEAEEQYQLATRSHLVVVDALLDLQYSRMAALEQEFNQDLKALTDEFDRWGGGHEAAHG